MNRTGQLDRIYQRAWTSHIASRELSIEKTWVDLGLTAAFDWVAGECAGEPLLEIGVGAGLTIPLMTQISCDYTGIEYSPRLLERVRLRFPDLDLRLMDARDMVGLESDYYALAAFCWNGIDCVDYQDRQRVLEEMYRVTRPGGLVLFSSHNRDGPGFRESIWKLRPRLSRNPLRFGWGVVRTLRLFPIATYHYLRHMRCRRDHTGYSIKAAAAHFFRIMIVYVTLPEQRRQLASFGFQIDAVFGSGDGKRIYAETQTSDAWWFHFIARKPAQARDLAPNALAVK
jgi:SAM-dependent methyltransferase